MRFQPTDEQRALAAGVRTLCERGRPSWDELTDIGVFALRVPESDGGVGLGMAETVLVFTELGRALVPGPLVGTQLAAGRLPEATRVGVLERESRPVLVEHLDGLDALLVLDRDGVWQVDARALDAEAVDRPVDPLTPLHLVSSLPVGEPFGGPELAARWRHEGAVLAAALQVGIAERVTERAVAYAKEREQFGRAIGSFQAVKHLCADMLARTELARVAVCAAGVALDDPGVAPPGGLDAAVATAKIMADEAAQANARACVQVHGGMGFTWEVDVHLYLKRAWVLATLFGTAEEHEEALANLL